MFKSVCFSNVCSFCIVEQLFLLSFESSRIAELLAFQQDAPKVRTEPNEKLEMFSVPGARMSHVTVFR